ncbi:L-arabinose transporter permease protein [mine drainage metagenome]|uniref:L-arabinose transporter permease protein n=1 Tax=mine drainage metagenome TaxID=410659 RepID=A0A1J5SZ65_9ZZZZ
MQTYTLIVLLLAATLRTATPLLLAALGGLFSERSGVVDLALEGKMLAAAFASAAVSAVTGSAWLGLGAGVLAGMALAALLGFACVTHRGNQVVAGMAINMIVAGLAPTLGLAWFDLGGQTPQLEAPGQRFMGLVWPWAHQAAHVAPFPGLMYSQLLSGHNLLVYLAVALVPLSAWVLYRTRFGLRLRAVGENPHAVDTAGVSVNALRYQAMLVSGALCGVAGTYLSTAAGAGFVRDMTAGKGYLALAALIFGKWKPWPALGACLLFAFADAAAARLQGVALPLVGTIPVQIIVALPYALTILLLAGFVGKSVAPKSIGTPYSKDR